MKKFMQSILTWILLWIVGKKSYETQINSALSPKFKIHPIGEDDPIYEAFGITKQRSEELLEECDKAIQQITAKYLGSFPKSELLQSVYNFCRGEEERLYMTWGVAIFLESQNNQLRALLRKLSDLRAQGNE